MIGVGKQAPSEGHFSIGGQPSRSASDTSPRPCGGQTGVGSLANEIALKFSQCSHQMEDEFPTWCRRVNALSQRDKLDPSIFKEVEGCAGYI